MKANPTTDRLAVRPREAAELLGISPRTLWSRTQAGQIRAVRVCGGCKGSPVIIPLATLPLGEPVALDATPDQQLYLSQAARILSISEDTIHRLVSAKEIPFSRPNGIGAILFRRSELAAWLASAPGTGK